MNNSRLIQSLGLLSNVEKKQFLRFISSSFVNTDANLVEITEILYKDENQIMTREDVFAAIFPGEEFDYFRISNLLSLVMKHLGEFLVHLHLQEDQQAFQAFLLAAAREKGMDKLYRSLERKTEKYFDELAVPFDEDFLAKYHFEDERNVFALSRNERQDHHYLDQKMEALELFYISAMLKTTCQRINQENVIQSTTHSSRSAEFIEYITANIGQFTDSPFIQIYYYILLTLIEPDQESHFKTLKSLLNTFSGDISHQELKPMFQYAQNYCIKQANRGKTVYQEELLGLYIQMIELELIYQDGWLSPWDFKNVVAMGVRLERFEWTETFISNYAEKLMPEFRENAMTFNLAQLYYGKKQYRKAMRLLTQVEFDDVYYLLGAKTILLKMYYELEEADGFDFLIHSFSAALRRNKKISNYQRTVHKNLIKWAKKLQRLRNRKYASGNAAVKKAIDEFLKHVEEIEAITQKEWLMRKAEEIISF
ncbi:MAG: hypothetical protein KDD99_03490 [Bacteroidetes bacterium]|nr:hypothetical protein [Bacteroidota bacterium]